MWDFVLHEGFIFLLSCDDLLDLRYTFQSPKSGLKYSESVHRTARASLVIADKYQVSAKKRTPATNSVSVQRERTRSSEESSMVVNKRDDQL